MPYPIADTLQYLPPPSYNLPPPLLSLDLVTKFAGVPVYKTQLVNKSCYVRKRYDTIDGKYESIDGKYETIDGKYETIYSNTTLLTVNTTLLTVIRHYRR